MPLMLIGRCSLDVPKFAMFVSKKSPTGPSERTLNPEYLTVLAIYLGVRW